MTVFKEVWTDTVRRVHAQPAETEVIRFTRPGGTAVWVTFLIMSINEPGNAVHSLTVHGITENGDRVSEEFLDGADEYPDEVSPLIPELVSASQAGAGPDEVLLSTGDVARAFGVTVKQVMAWDESGVLKPAFRTPGGHRRYREPDIARLCGDRRVARPRREKARTEEITRLRDTENLTWKQIGARLRISAEGARQRYNKARSGGPL